ncbi:putative siderophore iron transporter [Coniochaeta sp. 2T2.1]|nr:putative siderophore iron transporter [Coniochaeta sp. 2T2.1]
MAANRSASPGEEVHEMKVTSQQFEQVSVEAQKEKTEGDDVTKNNLVYDNAEEEPQLHLRTYVAFVALIVLNYVQIIALQGPPAVLTFIGKSLDNPETQTWVPNALSLVQAVLGPIVASASDTFQARKPLLIGLTVISFIGCAIAPGSKSIYRLIAAQALIGVGYSSTPLAYSVPAEMIPRKWRPLAQSAVNMAAALASITAPLIMGALTQKDPLNGWRNFYWIQMAFWGVAALGIFFGYRPPKRYTRYDHLSFWQKIKTLDLTGSALLTVGLSLMLTGLNLGGGLYTWTSARVLGTLIAGIVGFIAFALYQWKGTKSGLLHHDLFHYGRANSRTFAICCGLFALESIIMFAFTIFYPVLMQVFFNEDPIRLVSRSMPWWVMTLLSTAIWGVWSSKSRDIKKPLLVGFAILTGGTVGFATLQPGQSINALAFAAVSGLGFGAPVILILTGVQLAIPAKLIATATAVATSSRALGATMFTAIYTAAMTSRLPGYLADYVTKAAIGAGLPPSSLPMFIPALAGGDMEAVAGVPGVSPVIIEAGVAAMQQAYADAIRIVFIIAAAFSAAGFVAVFFIGDLTPEMDYRVDAPVEDLHASHHHDKQVQP